MGVKKKSSARLMKSEIEGFSRNEKIIEFYMNDPVEAARDLLNVELTWYQRIQLRELWTKPYCVMKWGRGASKTFVIAVYCILRGMLFPGKKIGVIGPTFRQSEYVFDEIDAIYNNSAYFRSAVVGGIKRTTAQCLCKFTSGSFIEGLPIGNDGSKIRGRRYNIVVLDEFAHHNEETIRLVVRPFLAVKYGDSPNQMIMCSSPFYTTNHFYKVYNRHKKKAKETPDLYSCTSFNFVDALIANHKTYKPDINQIYEAYQSDPLSDFLMEWAGFFPSDDASFFSSRLIASCEPRIPPGPIEIELTGKKGCEYVMGVDPAREEDGDNCAITICKLNKDKTRHVVKVIAGKGWDAPTVHNIIREQIHLREFNVTKICIDYGGGGKGIADLMKYGWDNDGIFYPPIVQKDEIQEELKLTRKVSVKNEKALPILEVVNFGSVNIDYMYTTLKADMEHKKVLFPVSLRRDDNSELETAGKDLTLLKAEMVHLEAKAGTRGLVFEAGDDKLGKDRITSLVLANKAFHSLYDEELAEEKEEINDLPIGFWV